jgi:glycosyltransferase involved in cell wall biosynthesis
MNILHLLFSPGWGGLERFAADQAIGMRERGHNVSFIRRQGTETAKYLAERNFPGQEWAPMKYIDIRAMLAIRRAARRIGASIVHVHHSADLGLAFPALIGAPDIGLIFSTYMYIPAPKNDLYHRIEYGMVRRVLTLSDQMTENARKNLPIAPEQAMTMPYGIDITRYDPSATPKGAIREKFAIPTHRPIIGLVGRLDPYKGQVEMIQAMPVILEKFPEAILALVGGETPELVGVYQAKLVAEVARLGVQKSVIFTGFAENPALPMADIDVYVIPSHHETFGMSAIEAMAMGLPVVASDTGGLPDILDHGGCGLLARAKDPASFAAAVIRYLSDEGLRESMGQKGREKALASHDRRKSMEKLEGIYREVVEGL